MLYIGSKGGAVPYKTPPPTLYRENTKTKQKLVHSCKYNVDSVQSVRC